MNFFKELQRRNVIRVAFGYIVSSWLLMQIADLLLDIIGSPDWVLRTIALVLALGLPVVVFFSWAYEVTPEGIKRESEIDRTQSIMHVTGRKLDRAIVLVLIIALAYFAYDKFVLDPQRDVELVEGITNELVKQLPAETQIVTPNDKDPASIAVLPFADLSPKGDQGYFSDGIAEEILNVLVKVDGLSVASRTSAFGFKDQGALGIPAIAEALKVRNVLEGSVRKSGDSIRITAQLIDAQSDKHLWSQTYDRELSTENLFAIQDEIARAIVAELAKSMKVETSATDMPMVSAATENLDAYQLYLQARDLYRQRSSERIPVSIELLERAVELDPNYAQAWAGLAAACVVAPGWGLADREYYELAFEAAQRSIELDDSLALPYAVLGSLETNRAPADFKKGFEYYGLALERNPKAVNALLWQGIDYMAVGEFEASVASLERCLVADPAYENCRRFMALSKLFAGEIEIALALFEEGILRGANSQAHLFAIAYIGEGDFSSGRLTLAFIFSDFYGPYTESMYRALAEPDFNFDKEWLKFSTGMAARTGSSFGVNELSNFNALVFQKYDAYRPVPYVAYWWHPHLPHFLASPHRKKVIREMGIYDYWRVAGFPSQCRPVGDDEFECD